MLVEPQLQRRTAERGDQTHGVAAVQALLDLALELRIEHLGRQHERCAREHVFAHQLDALGLQRVHLDEALHGQEQAFAQAGFVRAAGGVGIRLT
jgi:glycerol dehydrogenase-like iron-containing ADH family enzyme